MQFFPFISPDIAAFRAKIGCYVPEEVEKKFGEMAEKKLQAILAGEAP